MLARIVAVDAEKARVEPPDSLAAMPQQLLEVTRRRRPQITALHILDAETRVTRHLRRRARASAGASRDPCISATVYASFANFSAAWMTSSNGFALQRGRQRLVIPRRGRVRGQEQREGQFVAMIEAQRLQVDGKRDQHDAIEKDVVLFLQLPRQSRRAGGAIAFADQVLRAAPAAVAREVEADELAYRIEVALVLVELIHLLAFGHAASNPYPPGR